MKKQLDEAAARRSEIELMCGRLAALTKSSGISTDQRMGACMSLKILEARRSELEARRIP